MFRTYAFMLIALLAALVGCENTNPDTGDTPDDTNIPVEVVTITVQATLDGIEVEKQPVSLVDTADESLADGITGEPISVELRGTAQVKVGPTDAYVTADGYRIHEIGDAEYVHRAAYVDTDTSEDPVTVSLNRYVYGEDVECDVYRDGAYMTTFDEGTIETQDGYKLAFPEMTGDGSWFEFDGNSVEFVGDLPDDGFYLIDFEVQDSAIVFSYGSEMYTNEITCHLQPTRRDPSTAHPSSRMRWALCFKRTLTRRVLSFFIRTDPSTRPLGSLRMTQSSYSSTVINPSQ